MTILPIAQLKEYVEVVLPRIERDLGSATVPAEKKVTLYNLYVEVLRMCAHDDFVSFNKFLELDEDHSSDNKAFYYKRKDHMGDIFEALNDMEIYDKYDLMIVIMPPRVGKTTTGIRFLSWICGRYPESTELATSYSDNITSSFYVGVMEVLQSERFKAVFSDSALVNQNAKKEEIWLKTLKRYPTITFAAIEGSMVGRCEAGKYLYCDDLVSGYEAALSFPRMEKLWGLYTVNCKQRKLDGAKEIHIATPWSVHDVIDKLRDKNKDNPRCKIIHIPCFDEDGESNFKFAGGFSTAYYKDMEDSMDKASFSALYMGDPIEREGLLYHVDDLQYYFTLPEEREDTVISVCDSKNMGKDNVASPIGYVYGDLIYIEDVVYNNGLPEITRPIVAQKWLHHKVVRGDIELNNGGNYYAEDIDKLIRDGGGKTSIRMFFTGNNKMTKIITYADYVMKHFVFKDPSTYSKTSDYARFMKDVFIWTQLGTNKHDDSVDTLAMLAQLSQELSGNSMKILDRRKLGL